MTLTYEDNDGVARVDIPATARLFVPLKLVGLLSFPTRRILSNRTRAERADVSDAGPSRT